MSRTRALIRTHWGALPIAFAIAVVAVRACVVTAPLDRLVPVAREARDPAGLTPRAGSLDIARGGPVIVGFVSAGPARLIVGAKELVGAGLVKDRLVLPRGPIAVRFTGPAGARLVWSPVGRRGDPEYVPASSLSPDPPATATFGSDAGAAPVDGVVALLLLATLVGSLLYLTRARLRAVPRSTWIAMAAVFVVAVAARWIDLGGFGQAWDEDVNWSAGRNYITNLLSFDFSSDAWQWNYEHPPIMKYLAGIGAQLADGFGPARAMSAIWVALGCALFVPIGARLYRLRVGVLAGAIAALLPPLVAHGQIVGHESPTVLWWSLGVVLALGVHDELSGVRALRVRLAWVGVACGIAIASRFFNGLLGPLCAVIVVVQAPPAWRRRTLHEAAWILPLAAIVTFYLVWPRLWAHPVDAMLASLRKLDTVHAPEPFLGELTARPPTYYFVVYVLATLPVGALIGVVAWMVRTAKDIRYKGAIISLAWLAIALGVSLSPSRQDGVRYAMPAVAVLALCAAAGWDQIATWLEPRTRHAFTALATALVLYLAIVDIRIHPYYLDYFGEQVGGTSAVARRGWFETAWWGEGVDRAVDYVNDHAAPGAIVDRDCIAPAHLAWFREDLWVPMTREPRRATWLVVYAPLVTHCPIPADAHPVFEVTADGAVLAQVWQRP